MFEGFQGGVFVLLPLDADDMPAIAALMKRYESAGLQLADAALAHLAERENIRTVFTTDRRDFSIIRLTQPRAQAHPECPITERASTENIPRPTCDLLPSPAIIGDAGGIADRCFLRAGREGGSTQILCPAFCRFSRFSIF